MIATAYLGFTVGFGNIFSTTNISLVLVSIGPMIVNSLWTTVVYREITGKRNLIILVASLLVAIGGVVLLALSH
jgi:hypothetical protein